MCVCVCVCVCVCARARARVSLRLVNRRPGSLCGPYDILSGGQAAQICVSAVSRAPLNQKWATAVNRGFVRYPLWLAKLSFEQTKSQKE